MNPSSSSKRKAAPTSEQNPFDSVVAKKPKKEVRLRCVLCVIWMEWGLMRDVGERRPPSETEMCVLVSFWTVGLAWDVVLVVDEL